MAEYATTKELQRRKLQNRFPWVKYQRGLLNLILAYVTKCYGSLKDEPTNVYEAWDLFKFLVVRYFPKWKYDAMGGLILGDLKYPAYLITRTSFRRQYDYIFVYSKKNMVLLPESTRHRTPSVSGVRPDAKGVRKTKRFPE